MIEAIPMEGMKVSGDLVLVDVVDFSPAGDRLPHFLSGLAKTGINMTLFIGGQTEEGTRFDCCVAASDGARVKALMDANAELKTAVEFSAPVDLLTLFPHHFDLKVLGLGLTALGRARIPLHGFCSSLSAITFITDHTDLENASAALQGCFGLAAKPQVLHPFG
jgi:aspartokinase